MSASKSLMVTPCYKCKRVAEVKRMMYNKGCYYHLGCAPKGSISMKNIMFAQSFGMTKEKLAEILKGV